MKNITKKEMKLWLKYKLSTDKKWAERALFKIYTLQTIEEQSIKTTTFNNNIGFTGFDCFILTNMVQDIIKKRKKYPNYNFSNKQFNKIIFVKMPKYWNQILNISNQKKLKQYFYNDPFNIQMKLEV